jgi:chromosome partitioning protein
MANRIIVTSQKGGVGKTTVSLNLAVALAERNRRVLLVDLDPQGGVGLSLAKGETAFAGLTELLASPISPLEAVVETKLPGLRLLPRGRLDPIDVPAYEEAVFAPGTLDAMLAPLEESCDFMILDTPAGLGMATRAAFRVGNFVLVIAQADPLAMRSIGQLLRVLDHLRSTENPRLQLLGILPTMVDLRAAPSRGAVEELWTEFDGLLETILARSPVYAEASLKGLPLSFLGGPRCTEANVFDALAHEIEATIDRLRSLHEPHLERPERQLF